ncbi:hypothetical protein NBE98_10705 [Clostridium swellfunianum]|nr:hypothetical protein [Clostridium swellfunianum]MCM0648845.1 hypothetical protein [Clostridium swellfunianum]
MTKGLVMNTEELKILAAFFRKQGISPTIKELCSRTLYFNHFSKKAS